MFRLVRLFLLTSALAAAAVAISATIFWQSEVRRVIQSAESQNVILTRSFANTLWPQFSSYVMSASGENAATLATRPETRTIHETLATLMRELPVLKVKIYKLDGLTVFSTEPGEMGDYRMHNPGLSAAARDGVPASKLSFRNEISSFSGIVQDRDIVETYLPIRIGDGPIEGVFELYTDVSPIVASVRGSTVNLAVGFLAIFGLLYATLFVVVRRADRTIKSQYVDISEKNVALGREIAERQQIEVELKNARDDLERRVDERTRELRDEIAERKRAEDRARRHRNELAQVGAVITMGEMATSLAHEINQPLAVISGCAQLCTDALRMGNVTTTIFADSIQQIGEQAQRAHEIIRRIRSFIRKGEQERNAVDLNKTVQGIEDLLRIDANEHGAAVELDLADVLPPVLVDSIQIQQVILNLAHNGIEAMSDGAGGDRRLTVATSKPRDGEVEIAVHDTGGGMPPEMLNRVFDPFFTTKPGGLGMGLAISRSIVEAHGGRIWAMSDGGGGTVFRFRLPSLERVDAV